MFSLFLMEFHMIFSLEFQFFPYFFGISYALGANRSLNEVV